MEVKHASHCTYRIRYHMVFVVKYRKKMLLDPAKMNFLKGILIGIGERYYFEFDAIGIESEHFHVVVCASPKYSPSRIMQIIKSITARMIFKEFPEIRKQLWGGKFWHEGGHVDTVSEYGGLDVIKRYVEEQGRMKDQLKLDQFL